VRIGRFNGVLLSALTVTSVIALAIPLLSPRPVHAALTSHDPILIVGNDNFTVANGVNGGGSGTENDPYIIENYVIAASTANGIDIRNTSAYFIVRNCVVGSGVVTYTGIYLYNVTNGGIENNACGYDNNGICLDSSDSNKLENNTCEDSYRGIYLTNSDNNIISSNTIWNNSSEGISFTNSDNNTLDNNTCENNGGSGISLDSSNNNTISNSVVTSNNRGVHFTYSAYNIILGCDFSNNVEYGVDVGDTSSHHNTITNCNIWGTQNYWGVSAYAGSDYTEITNCNVWNNSTGGIGLGWSNSMLVENCNIHNNGGGLTLDTTNNCIVENCRIYSNTSDGVHMGHYPSNNIVRNCEIYSNGTGVFFYTYSNNNILTNCIIQQNENYGVRCFVSSYSNVICHNNIIQNGQQAWDEGAGNLWDNGYPSGGNYWSDYTGMDIYHGPNQNIPGSDGLGDTTYNILGGSSVDHYPLMLVGTATLRLENLYKVSLEVDLQLYTGSVLTAEFYKYDNTLQDFSFIESITPPENIKENENVPHPRGVEGYPWGTVQIVTLTLADSEGNVISTIASFTVHQGDLRGRYMTILRAWAGSPEQQDAFRSEVMDILRQWAGAPV
jgi:parallel beta-helix repeat protein